MRAPAQRVTFEDLRAVERSLSALADRQREYEKSISGPFNSLVERSIADARHHLFEAMREAALDERLDAEKARMSVADKETR